MVAPVMIDFRFGWGTWVLQDPRTPSQPIHLLDILAHFSILRDESVK